MTPLTILKFALLGVHTRIQGVKKEPMLESVREKRLASLEAQRKEIHEMIAKKESFLHKAEIFVKGEMVNE